MKYYHKTTSSQKLAVRHTNLVCPTASFEATGGFKLMLFQIACMVYKHAHVNTLLLWYSTFIRRVVKMLLKGVVVGCALNSHGNYIFYHGK